MRHEGLDLTSTVTTLTFQSPLIFNPDAKKEVWRFITYMFVHSGYFHIAFNVLIQVLTEFINMTSP